MIKRMMPYILVTVFFLLDCTVLPMLTSAWFVPVFSLALVHVLGLLMGRSRGVLLGLISGLLMDISSSTPLGRMTIICVLLAYTGGLFGRYLRALRPIFTVMISAAVSFALYELFMDAYVIFSSAQYNGTLFLHSLVRVPIYVGLTLGLRHALRNAVPPAPVRT